MCALIDFTVKAVRETAAQAHVAVWSLREIACQLWNVNEIMRLQVVWETDMWLSSLLSSAVWDFHILRCITSALKSATDWRSKQTVAQVQLGFTGEFTPVPPGNTSLWTTSSSSQQLMCAKPLFASQTRCVKKKQKNSCKSKIANSVAMKLHR